MAIQFEAMPIASSEPENRLTTLARELMNEFPDLRSISWRVDRDCGDYTDYKYIRQDKDRVDGI